MKKEKQETKRENKLRASHRSLARSLAHGGPPSPRISLTHFDEEEEREGENFLMFFFYLAFPFYLPSLSCLGRRSAVERRRGVAGA